MQNKTTTVNRGVAILLVIMLLFNGLMPTQVYAEVPLVPPGGTSGSGVGQGDSGDTTGAVGSSGHFNWEWQGLRVYLVNRDNEIVSTIVDITTIDPSTVMGSNYTKYNTAKDGNSGKGWIPHKLSYYEHFPDMPLPYGHSGSKYPRQGTLIDAWFESITEDGKSKLQEWLDRVDVFKLRDGDKGPIDVFLEEDLVFVYEPIVWVEDSTWNGGANWTGYWFYGTPTDLGYDMSAKGTTFSGSASPIKSSFPRSIYIDEELPVEPSPYTVYTGNEDKIKREYEGDWWSLSEFSPDTEGYGIGWQQPNGGGTRTWDEPNYPDTPEKPPEEEGNEEITIIKNYVVGDEHESTWVRLDTLKQIRVESEPDVGYELVAYLLHI